MAQISVNHLTFYYDGSYDNIFEDVSFQLDTDWKLGLVGRNGRGKTTLLQLLMGKYEYCGRIHADTGFTYFPPVILENEKKKNTMEVLEQLWPDYEFWMLCRELNLLGADTELLYRPFETLSNGEQTKVLLACLFAQENRFLLIDEPTNHLDMEARKAVRDYLGTKRGFILVSHDRLFLDSCIDHILVINKESICLEKGNFSSWQENKRRQDQYELAESSRLKKEIKRLSEAAGTAGRWADKTESEKIGGSPQKDREMRDYIGEKSRRMQQRRKNLERRQQREIAEKKQLLKNVETADQLKLIPQKHNKEVLLRAEKFSVYYGEKKVTDDMTFTVKTGDRLILQGRNGCGKSSVLKKILGEEIQTQGLLELAGGLKLSYVSQDASYLKGSLTAFIREQGIDETRMKALLYKLCFDRSQFDKNMEEYSSGQKKKVLIAKSLCEQAHLYIWDEPLNYIDIFSRMQIEELIKQFQPTMLLAEHDEFFVKTVGTKFLSL